MLVIFGQLPSVESGQGSFDLLSKLWAAATRGVSFEQLQHASVLAGMLNPQTGKQPKPALA